MRMGAGQDGLARGTLDDKFLTSSIIRISSKMTVRGSFSLLVSLGVVFGVIKIPAGTYNIYTPIPPFSVRRGGREWVDGNGLLWMTFPFGNASRYLILDNNYFLHGILSSLEGSHRLEKIIILPTSRVVPPWVYV
jgi:hypothetical protein